MTELNFSKKGGEEYFIEVKARATATHYLGEEKEARNTELFASYSVNGVPGYGMVEWNYRNLNKDWLRTATGCFNKFFAQKFIFPKLLLLRCVEYVWKHAIISCSANFNETLFKLELNRAR